MGDRRSSPRPRALLVDFGGVMTTSMGRAFARFCLETGVDPELFKSLFAEAYSSDGEEGMMARLERGEVPLEDFEAWLAAALSQGLEEPVAPEGLKDRLFSGLVPDEEMVAAVAALRRAGVKTALVSNSWGNTGYDRARSPDLFDEVVVSSEVGVRKPDPAIFRLAADRLGVPAAECVFVDDLEQNAVASRNAGMVGIVHRSPEFTIPKLEDLFGVSLS